MFRNVKRKVIRLSDQKLIKTDYLDSGQTLLLVLQPEVEDVNLIVWLQNNFEFIETELLKHGALLFRNFNIDSIPKFERFVKSISPELVEYTERRSPRTDLGDKIYTSTVHPADQYIHFHNTTSYSHQWPMKLWFCCLKPAKQGGRTPIADCRKVLKRISPKLKEQFMQKGVMYVRNFHEGIGLSWQTTFQTTEKSDVEDYCRKADINFEWVNTKLLRTRQVRHAVATHPKTHEMVWFNQAHHFHVLSLEPEVSRSLLDAYDEEDLPRNAYYGDGSPIEATALDEIIGCYQQEQVSFPWEKGDVLMLDNMLAAHSRTPFVGERLIALALAEMYSPSQRDGDTRGFITA